MIAMEPQALSLVSLQITLFVTVSLCIGSASLALLLHRSEVARLRNRLKWIAASAGQRRTVDSTGDEHRRRIVEDTLREIQAKERASGKRNARPTLIRRMRQAGIGWTRSTYLTISFLVGMIGYVMAFSWLGVDAISSVCIGVATGLLLPHAYVQNRRSRRMNAFTAEFPNALDTVVRGVQSGLALVDCLKIIAAETQEPVKSEFAGIVHDQKLGLSLEEAMERMAGRVPLPEANFFSIMIAIQTKTGGNLAEALNNLSKILRDRKAIRAKIKALSAEAKASAGIIGCMPIGVGTILYFVSQDYVSLLFTTPTGNMALGLSAFLMTIGILIMRKMINFNF